MQSNRAQIKEQVIDRLAANGLRCPFKKDSEPREYGGLVDEYLEAVYERQMSPQDLHDAMSSFVRSWKYARWPTIGQLLEALQPPPIHYTQEALKKPEREKWAEQVMRMPEGQQALREGYGRELYLWAERNPGQVPGVDVMQECSLAEQSFRAAFRKQIDLAKMIGRDPKEPMKALVNGVVLTAGATMDARENQLKKEYLDAV